MKPLVRICTLILAMSCALAHADRESDKRAVEEACKAEAETAGCKGMVMGKGLGKCLFAFKKTHSAFHPSAGCKAAMKKLRQDRR